MPRSLISTARTDKGYCMTLRWIIATLHLLALPLGLGAVWARSRALGHVDRPGALERAFRADTLWGLAAALWISTGLLRAFGGLEKGSTYYLHNHVFFAKVGLLVAILLLEIWPMTALIRWRIAARRGHSIDTASGSALARISQVQAALVILMVFAATALARGFFQ
jgi:putative membrane protein